MTNRRRLTAGTRVSRWTSLAPAAVVVLSNSSAFSATDTMPLSSRATLLMSVQSTSALLITLIIIARAVGALQ